MWLLRASDLSRLLFHTLEDVTIYILKQPSGHEWTFKIHFVPIWEVPKEHPKRPSESALPEPLSR